ncbi:hypothetical protein [Lacinutrix sp. Bg11-31]|nr:hypothetical protein [Lacinutrix sp. Bg11-31]
MKRVTFVFIGIVAITSFVLLSQKKIEDKSIVKVDMSKHYIKGIYE